MYRVIVAGSRTFDDFDLLEDTLIDFLIGFYPSEIQIVSGGARGADSLGEKFAEKYGCKIKRFTPDWNIGKQAGILRNIDMGNYADALVAFWDGKSKGTKHMIQYAKELGLKVEVIKFGG